MAMADGDVSAVFEEIGNLEKQFAQVELDALRRKEHDLKPLYTKRQTLVQNLPDFWPSVFPNGPEEIQQFFSPADLAILGAIKSFSVDRYQIESETQGEPRSLRFTFEFADNEHITDTKLVKDFEYKPSETGPGNLISKPVPIKWKSKKRDVTKGLLNAAVELHAAEEAVTLKGDSGPQVVEREGLWQYEKLREKVVQLDEETDQEPSFMNWFGFRGAVESHTKVSTQNGRKVEDGDDEEDEEEEDEMLEVEIFPAGEEVAIALAEDFWPNVLDYFMRSQAEPPADFDGLDENDENDEDGDDEDVPDLVAAEEESSSRPKKKQRMR